MLEKKIVAIIALLVLSAGTARAKELELTGRASVSVSASDPQSIRAMAINEAKRNAVISGVTKIIGPEAAKTPKVSSQVQSIVDQIRDEKIIDTKGQRVGEAYEMSVTLVVDDKDFRTLISDAGIAANTAATRAMSILGIMDEFVTIGRDLRAPLEELTEFKAEKGSSFRDKSVAAQAAASASSAKASYAASLDARSASSSKSSGAYDGKVDASGRMSAAASNGTAAYGTSREGRLSARESAAFSGQSSSAGSVKAAEVASSSSTSAQSRSALSAKNVASEDHDNVYYKKLVKYQPQNKGPEKVSQTYNALAGQLQDYDLRMIDNDLFRSKYFKDKPITIEQLQNSEELVKYVGFAKKEANADFFMVGTSIIVDSGINPNTGQLECTAVVTMKTFSTVNAESIASETVSESSSGRNLQDCAANVAKKIAAVGGPVMGARIQDYWKRRATYGREYILTLTGSSLPLMLRTIFSKAIKGTVGVESMVQRASTDKEHQIVVTYKGEDPLDQAVAMELSANPAFSSLDSRTDGNQITLCMGPCVAAVADTGKGKKK